MSARLPALYQTQFPVEMLRDIALLDAPELVSETYGFDFERIKDLPNFKAQLAKVESELLNEGTITRAMAEIGLNKAVETINVRIASQAISNEDLNKFTNTLHKITNRDKAEGTDSAKPQFTIEINLGSDSYTLTTNKAPVPNEIDVTPSDTAGEVPLLEEEDLEPIPQDLLDDILQNNDFGLDLD